MVDSGFFPGVRAGFLGRSRFLPALSIFFASLGRPNQVRFAKLREVAILLAIARTFRFALKAEVSESSYMPEIDDS